MPKVGMETVRRKALIDATILTIGERGSLDVTMSESLAAPACLQHLHTTISAPRTNCCKRRCGIFWPSSAGIRAPR